MTQMAEHSRLRRAGRPERGTARITPAPNGKISKKGRAGFSHPLCLDSSYFRLLYGRAAKSAGSLDPVLMPQLVGPFIFIHPLIGGI